MSGGERKKDVGRCGCGMRVRTKGTMSYNAKWHVWQAQFAFV